MNLPVNVNDFERGSAPGVELTATAMQTDRLCLGYGDRLIVEDLSVEIPSGQVTAIVGPNGCGKSTLLRSLARLLKPASGGILLNGADIHQVRTHDLARQLAMLPQSPVTPGGISVRELVGYGRFPHQGLVRGVSREDRRAIDWAMEITDLHGFGEREVDTLSGGERQRAWIAMALAQQTDLLLLDEPTTFLDIHYQLDLLSLVRTLNHEHGLTVVWVLHDLNQAASFSDHIIMLKGGQVICKGDPRNVMTPESIRTVFNIECCVIHHPMGAAPVCVPNSLCPLVQRPAPASSVLTVN
jgi:iron complex transport system ATP-binding protein